MSNRLVEYFGYIIIIHQEGPATSIKKINKLKVIKAVLIQSKFKVYPGLLTHYGKFLPNITSTLARTGISKYPIKVQVRWLLAFVNSGVLVFPDYFKPFILPAMMVLVLCCPRYMQEDSCLCKPIFDQSRKGSTV